MEIVNYNFIQLVILLVSIHGIIFSLVVFFSKNYSSKSNTFLGLMILFMSISNIHHISVDINFISQASIIRKLYFPWHWLVIPMFYLFSHYFFYDKPLNNKGLFFLFAPVFLVVTLHSLQFLYQLFINPEHPIPRYYQRGLFLYTNLMSFIYIPPIVYSIHKMRANFEKNARNKNILEKIKRETNWIKNMIYFSILIESVGTIIVLIGIKLNMKESFYTYPFFISLSIFIYWVGYAGFRKLPPYLKIGKPNNLSTSKHKGFNVFKKIDAYILSEKMYLESDINRDLISKKFNISTGYLSQIVNHHTKGNFNDYINKLRVDCSRKKLLDTQYDNYTIELIGLECGFKSKSSFYAAFKRHIGKTPNQFKNENKS